MASHLKKHVAGSLQSAEMEIYDNLPHFETHNNILTKK